MINPFTPKSDQYQISPAALPEILCHTVWRTWPFIALLRWKMIITPILTTSLIRVSLGRLGECTFWTWEWKGSPKLYIISVWCCNKPLLVPVLARVVRSRCHLGDGSGPLGPASPEGPTRKTLQYSHCELSLTMPWMRLRCGEATSSAGTSLDAPVYDT